MEEFMNSLHFGTRFLLVFMVVLYIIQMLFFDDTITYYLTFCPRLIIEKFQFWRLLSGTLIHGGLMHIAMNMLSFSQLGITFESHVGTLSYFFHIFIFSIIQGLIHIVMAYVMYLGGDPSAWYGHAVGFSGVLFALIVVDIAVSGGDSRSVFGLFLVSSWIYPWAQLFIMSLLLPNVSFLGHLSGILAGYLYQFNVLKFVTPPARIFHSIERKMCCCCLNRLGYISAEGVAGARPFAVFQHTFNNNDDDADNTDHQVGFQGQGRTLGGNMPQQVDTITDQNRTINANNNNNANNNIAPDQRDENDLEPMDIHLSDDDESDDAKQNRP